MVIIEGPDGGGKTTLINQVATLFDIEVQPRACTSDNGVDPATLRDWVDRDLADSGKRPHRRLYDRHPLISEPIYGPLIRGRMANGFADLFWLRNRIDLLEHDRHGLLVFCLPPEREVMKNITYGHNQDTEHLRGVHKNARAIYQQYVYIAALWKGPSVVWDYTQPEKFEAVIEEVRMYL